MSDTDTKRWKAAAGLTRKAAKLVNIALGAITTEGKTHSELWGVVGADEHRGDYYMPIGGPLREDCSKTLGGLAEKYRWIVSQENYKQLVADAEAALPALKAARPVVDKRRTPEQEAERIQKTEAAERERIEKEQQEHESIEALIEQMRPQFAHFRKFESGTNRHVWTGRNLRFQLERAFGFCSWSIKSSYSSIDVSWKMGPSEAEVDKIASLYRLKTTGTREEVLESRARERLIGGVSYVQLAREIPGETRALAARYMAEALGLEFHSMDDKPGISEPGADWWTETHRLFVGQSFPPGAEITGVKADEVGVWHIEFTAGTAAAGCAITVRYNRRWNGVELKFPEKPSDDVIEKIRSAPHRFRWLRKDALWYTRCSPASWAWTHQLAGIPEPPYPSAAADPAGAYVQAQEDAQQDAIAAAIGA